MRKGVKIFGTFNGISPQAFERLEEVLDFDEVSYEGGTVVVEHDGEYEQVEDVVLRVMEAMAEGHESGLDIIDHDGNTITRYVIEADGFRAKRLNMDDVVAPYPNSQA
jgi:hypothetical protein